jgi:copper(I)-binding protein
MSNPPSFFKTFSYLLTFLFSASLSASFAHQHDNHKHHDAMSDSEELGIMVMGGYARATFSMAKTGAVYFTLHNQNASEVTLTAVDVDASIASDAQIHTTEMQGDVMKMREMTEGVTVAPDSMVDFKPGGYHIMLLGLTKGLTEGSDIALTLTFDKQRKMHVVLPVKKDENVGHHHHH